GPHGQFNSGGLMIDDILGSPFAPKARARYHSVTTGWPNYDYIISKFDSVSSGGFRSYLTYDEVGNHVDNRLLAIDVLTVRKRAALAGPRLSELFEALSDAGLNYNFILCNFCPGKTTAKLDPSMDFDVVGENKKNPTIDSLPGWDNSGV